MRTNRSALRIIALFAFGVLQLSVLSNCTVRRAGVEIGSPAPPPPKPKSGPPPWAPAHGYRAKHKYRYYPSHYVYYDVDRGVYFYIEGDGWRVSARLPGRIHLDYADYVHLEMKTAKPYEYFADHRAKYPPGQAKKKKGKKRK